MAQDLSDSLASWHPVARLDADLVLTAVGDEVLVYDLARHHIHHLNPTSQTIWRLCDGSRTLPALAEAAGAQLGAVLAEEVVRLALRQLAEARLLIEPLPPELLAPGLSRRRLVRRGVTAGAVALPALISITAPAAAMATSHCMADDERCTTNDQCCSGICYLGIFCARAGCLPGGSPCALDSQCCTSHCSGQCT